MFLRVRVHTMCGGSPLLIVELAYMHTLTTSLLPIAPLALSTRSVSRAAAIWENVPSAQVQDWSDSSRRQFYRRLHPRRLCCCHYG